MARQRILFVDDEERVLEALQRMLRPMRREWDLAFASSAAEALELLAQASVDVLVSDMRMPGMDGAELMTEVMRRYPQTVRIALSGQSDEQMNMRSVGPTHQYLSKPCDPEVLKATVRRTCALRDELDNGPLKQLVAALGSLPSLPELYIELVDLLNAPDPSIQAVGEVIGRDPAMAARMLQLVNSAFFGTPRRIASAEEAVALLGFERVKELVLVMGAFRSMEDPGIPDLPLDRLWRHAVRTGRYAGAIVRSEGLPQAAVDEAQTAGLLHDVGRLVLATHLGDEYRAVVRMAAEQRVELWQVEAHELGATHSALGAYLLGIWGLPPNIVEATAHHHQPNESTGFSFTTLTAVHVANSLEHADVPVGPFPLPPIDRHYIARLGVAPRLEAWRDACTVEAQTAAGAQREAA